MAEVTQKVKLDGSQYRSELKKMNRENKANAKQLSKDWNEVGNAFDDLSERTKRKANETSGALDELSKSFKFGLGAFSAVGALGISQAIGGQVKEGLDFSSTVNKLGVQGGLNEFQQRELRNQLLDVSSRRDVEEELVAASASTAVAFGAATDEAVKFADVIAGASKLQEGLDPTQLAEDVARDLRARGKEVTAAAAQESIEALLTGARAGFKDIGTALAATTQVEGGVQRRAGLSQRDLINLFAGARLGAAAAPEETTAAIKELITLTDTLQGEALQGVLGAFRGPEDREGNRDFNLGAAQLSEAAKRLGQVGDERVQRQVLQDLGFSKSGVEGLLAIVKDRGQVTRQTRRVEADEIGLEAAITASTDNFLDGVSKFFNAVGNRLKRQRVVQEGEIVSTRLAVATTAEDIERRRQKRGPLSFPTLEEVEARRGSQGDNVQTGTPPRSEDQGEQKIKIEIDSLDPAFTARPKTSDLNRSAQGI